MLRIRNMFGIVLLTLVVTVVFTLVAGCAPKPAAEGITEEVTAEETKEIEEATPEEAPSPELAKVNLRLSWLVKGEYAPLFVALNKGYFEEEGIEMNIIEGSEKATPTQLLISGEDQFAYIAADDVIRARAAGMPVVMVANILRKTPQIVMALPETKMDNPQDMAGKKLVDTAGGTLTLILKAFLQANGVDPASVEVVIADWGAKNTLFLEGDVDMMSAYGTNDLPTLQIETGLDFNYFSVADYGFNMLAHGLVVSEEYLKNNPDVIRGVIKAVQRGVEFTIDNPEEAADISTSLYPENLKQDITRLQVEQTIKHFYSENTEGKPIGWQSEEDWERTVTIIYENGGVDSREEATKYFTNELIE